MAAAVRYWRRDALLSVRRFNSIVNGSTIGWSRNAVDVVPPGKRGSGVARSRTTPRDPDLRIRSRHTQIKAPPSSCRQAHHGADRRAGICARVPDRVHDRDLFGSFPPGHQSVLIDKLVRGGLARRVEGALDRRQRNVILTAKGRSLIDRIAAARSARFDSSLAALAPALATRLESILDEVVSALGEAGSPAANRTTASPARRRTG